MLLGEVVVDGEQGEEKYRSELKYKINLPNNEGRTARQGLSPLRKEEKRRKDKEMASPSFFANCNKKTRKNETLKSTKEQRTRTGVRFRQGSHLVKRNALEPDAVPIRTCLKWKRIRKGTRNEQEKQASYWPIFYWDRNNAKGKDRVNRARKHEIMVYFRPQSE